MILTGGSYTAPDGTVAEFRDDLAASVAESALWTPAQLARLVNQAPASARTDQTTRFAVENETTLAAASRLTQQLASPDILCLNFASAHNPGGGFQNGAQAQEESLARSSGLYPTLIANPSYYQANGRAKTKLYTHHMIHSPDVPVFRDDDGNLLRTPYQTSILTAPAVNAGAVRKTEPQRVDEILPTMHTRIGMVLALAAHLDYQHLVLGAWGCGVFRNDPDDIADLFAGYLTADGAFAAAFESITFAVLDDATESILRPFRERFDP